MLAILSDLHLGDSTATENHVEPGAFALALALGEIYDEDLRARMHTAVGAADERTQAADGIFPHSLAMKPYGVLARHGHELDPLSFEAFEQGRHPDDHADDAYKATLIGDAITTELVTCFPYEVKRRLAGERGLTLRKPQ